MVLTCEFQASANCGRRRFRGTVGSASGGRVIHPSDRLLPEVGPEWDSGAIHAFARHAGADRYLAAAGRLRDDAGAGVRPRPRPVRRPMAAGRLARAFIRDASLIILDGARSVAGPTCRTRPVHAHPHPLRLAHRADPAPVPVRHRPRRRPHLRPPPLPDHRTRQPRPAHEPRRRVRRAVHVAGRPPAQTSRCPTATVTLRTRRCRRRNGVKLWPGDGCVMTTSHLSMHSGRSNRRRPARRCRWLG